jgi:hypothetical protein
MNNLKVIENNETNPNSTEVEFEGQVHPPGQENNYNGNLFTKFELINWKKHIVGKPIYVDHDKSICVGKIKSAFIDEKGGLSVIGALDVSNGLVSSVVSQIKNGYLTGLSLGIEQIEKNGIVLFKKIEEVSLTNKPKLDTKIKSIKKLPTKLQNEIDNLSKSLRFNRIKNEKSDYLSMGQNKVFKSVKNYSLQNFKKRSYKEIYNDYFKNTWSESQDIPNIFSIMEQIQQLNPSESVTSQTEKQVPQNDNQQQQQQQTPPVKRALENPENENQKKKAKFDDPTINNVLEMIQNLESGKLSSENEKNNENNDHQPETDEEAFQKLLEKGASSSKVQELAKKAFLEGRKKKQVYLDAITQYLAAQKTKDGVGLDTLENDFRELMNDEINGEEKLKGLYTLIVKSNPNALNKNQTSPSQHQNTENSIAKSNPYAEQLKQKDEEIMKIKRDFDELQRTSNETNVALKKVSEWIKKNEDGRSKGLQSNTQSSPFQNNAQLSAKQPEKKEFNNNHYKVFEKFEGAPIHPDSFIAKQIQSSLRNQPPAVVQRTIEQYHDAIEWIARLDHHEF